VRGFNEELNTRTIRTGLILGNSYLLLEPRGRAEQTFMTVIRTAYVQGVSTRKVDDLVQALGLSGIDKSKMSRICKELDKAVGAFRNRQLEEPYLYLWLDAVYLKVRLNHRIVNMALVIAIAVREMGERYPGPGLRGQRRRSLLDRIPA